MADLQVARLYSQISSKKTQASALFFLTVPILLDTVEYVTIASTSHQAWLFYSLRTLRNSNALCGIPFWEAKQGLLVEFVNGRLHIDVE